MNAEMSHRLLLSTMNSIPDPLMIFDGQMQLVLMNSAAEALFGTFEAGTEASALLTVEALTAFLFDGTPLPEWSTSSGRVFVPKREPVVDEHGMRDGVIFTLRDVTQFKKLIRSQTEFIRIVSHDIRSPLTYIQGFANMLAMVGTVNERQEHFVEKVLSGISQITMLVDNIQDAGRFDPETGFYEMSREQCDLQEIIQRIVQNHLVPAEKGELAIHSSVAQDVPIINADKNMVERALTNLVDNAIKYSPNGGQVKVSAYIAQNNVILSVADNGYGINPDNQKQLFQRHVRLARQEHKKIKGSGLGLFIVKSVAQRHGGNAWVESEEGKGSTFFLSIPLQGDNLIFHN